MFPTRYFPDRYFAPRYFPKVGATASTPTVGSVKYRLEPQSHVYTLDRVHRTYRLEPQSRTYTADRSR